MRSSQNNKLPPSRTNIPRFQKATTIYVRCLRAPRPHVQINPHPHRKRTSSCHYIHTSVHARLAFNNRLTFKSRARDRHFSGRVPAAVRLGDSQPGEHRAGSAEERPVDGRAERTSGKARKLRNVRGGCQQLADQFGGETRTVYQNRCGPLYKRTMSYVALKRICAFGGEKNSVGHRSASTHVSCSYHRILAMSTYVRIS